jgi:hypothetical protein
MAQFHAKRVYFNGVHLVLIEKLAAYAFLKWLAGCAQCAVERYKVCNDFFL